MKKQKWTSRLVVGLLVSTISNWLVAFPEAQAFGPVAPEKQAHDAGVEAYEYAYPLVLMGVTRALQNASATAVKNKFLHKKAFVDSNFRDVVRPNADTLYSTAWLDLTREPLVLTVPDTQDRYYVMQIMDAWSEVFAAPGKRTTGTLPGNFAIVGPGWKGNLPAGVQRLSSQTKYVWIICRTQTNGAADFAAVNVIQSGFKLTPLSAYVRASGGEEIASSITSPSISSGSSLDPSSNAKITPSLEVTSLPAAEQVANMDAIQFFSTFSKMLLSNPPHKEDAAMVAKLKLLGIEVGSTFQIDMLTTEKKTALESSVSDARAQIADRAKTISSNENGWLIERKVAGQYSVDYLDRAAVALIGLGMNKMDDAVYPMCSVDSQGQTLDGANSYILHFEKGQLPPVKAFWSLSLYDAQGHFFDNEIKRFSIGDRDKLQYGPDGSLNLYIQSVNPGKEKEANWLPTPKANFNLMMRLYWPKTTVLNGAWVPPSIKRSEP